MATFLSVLLCIGAVMFTIYSTLKLIGLIKERKAKKVVNDDVSDDVGKGVN